METTSGLSILLHDVISLTDVTSFDKIYEYNNVRLYILITYTPQNNWRTNAINHNIDAFCV